jgi:nucleotide-binding universal stress UspA family protein
VTVFYPGATERCSVSDPGTPSVYLIDVDSGDLSLTTRSIKSAGRPDTPREFIPVTVEFLEETDGIERVETRLNEELGTSSDATDALVFIRLTGEDTSLAASDVYNYLNNRGVAVPHVVDDRDVDIALDFDSDGEETKDVDTLLDEAVSELDLSQHASDSETLVREGNVADGEIREAMNERIRETQDEKFGEITIEER